MVRRLSFLKYLYINGVDTLGHISLVNHDGYREVQSMLELEHEYQGEDYKILTDLRHSAFYKCGFRLGDNVIIRFDPENPEKGVIRDAYYSIGNKTASFSVTQLIDSVPQNKLTHMDTGFLPSEFVFVNRWLSDRIDTILSPQQLIDIIVEFGRRNYSVDEQRNRILIRDNFSVKINISKFVDKDIFMLEFRRYYHRIYAVYVILSIIIAFMLLPYLPPTRASVFIFYVFMLPIAFIWMGYELVRGIKNIKSIEYDKEAERVYFEILAAVREKEKEIA